MSAASLRMSDAETMKFLELYRNEPALWDPTNEGYKKRETRAAAAQRIAEALNLPDFAACHAIIKFKNLRSSYAQELKKIAASTKSGVAEDIYVPKVIWFKIMDSFLRPHVKSRSAHYLLYNPPQHAATVNINPDGDETEYIKSEAIFEEDNAVIDPSEYHEPLTEPPGPSIEQTQHFTEDQCNSSTRAISEIISRSRASCSSQTQLKRPPKKCRVQKKRTTENEKLDKIMLAMNKLHKERTTSKDDIFDHFGRYIASLLRTLPTQKALKLQQEMITLVLNTMHISNSSPSSFNCHLSDLDAFSTPSASRDTWTSELSAIKDSYPETN